MLSGFLVFHENIELIPSGESYDPYLGKNDPTERITISLVGIPIINQLVWEEIAKEDLA